MNGPRTGSAALKERGTGTMRAAQINRYGSDAVEIRNDAPKPLVSAGRILVEVYAAGINPIDWKIREGHVRQWRPLAFPATLGTDFSGIVRQVGEGVTGFKAGDEVYGRAEPSQGSFAEFVLADPAMTALKPRRATPLEAAAWPLAGVSALQGLTEHMALARGRKILIHGGAGGIGSIAVQLARHLGAYVATTVSRDAMPFASELGADRIIDRTRPFEEELSDYDFVFDTAGGEAYRRSFKVLKKGGVIVSMLEQPDAEMMKQYGVHAIGELTRVTAGHLKTLAELIDQGTLRMYIDRTFPLEQAGEALTYLQKGHPRGKVVLTIRGK